jgi:hypothetical protein
MKEDDSRLDHPLFIRTRGREEFNLIDIKKIILLLKRVLYFFLTTSLLLLSPIVI